jgi:glycosyltransferase involved in cell wall biosynthesis
MSRDAVTVVIPVWDRYCHFLAECVDSVLSQAGERPRVIVVDNASREPLPALPAGIDLVRSAERLSVGAARNLALAGVETRWVVFCDADDLLLPGTLAFLRGRMAARPQLVACVCRHVSWDPTTDARVLRDRAPRPIVFRVARHRRVFALANLRYNCFPIAGAMLRAEAVMDAGGFGDVSVGEDWILGTQLAFRGPIEFNERPGFLRRVHSGSLWYRPHAAGDYLRRCDLLRARVKDDPAVPGWVKASLPVLARVHRRDVRRATRDGALEPEHPLLQAREASP